MAVTAAEGLGRTGVQELTFEAFWHQERDGLYRALTLALGDSGLAAESVDEGMVRAYQRWSRIRQYDNPAGWVYRVSLNWARSHQRRLRRLSIGGVPDHAAGDNPPVADPALHAAVAALPEPQRDVVVLRFTLDWPIERIAASLEVPEGTVKSRLHRGLDRLRTQLEDHREL